MPCSGKRTSSTGPASGCWRLFRNQIRNGATFTRNSILEPSASCTDLTRTSLVCSARAQARLLDARLKAGHDGRWRAAIFANARRAAPPTRVGDRLANGRHPFRWGFDNGNLGALDAFGAPCTPSPQSRGEADVRRGLDASRASPSPAGEGTGMRVPSRGRSPQAASQGRSSAGSK